MTLSAPIITKVQEELHRLEEDCTHSGKAHFNACTRWDRWNYVFGIPSVILSAAAGTAFFENYTVAAGIMSVSVTVLTALMTFLKPAERSTSHKNSGDQYLALRNDSRVFREITLLTLDDSAGLEGMAGLTKRRNELNQASYMFSNGDFRKAKAGIDAGQALHKVDKGGPV